MKGLADRLDPALWCVNIHGPDDVIAAADHFEAVKLANRFNAFWEALKADHPQREHDPRMWAVPIEWPHGAESHAASIASPSEEYAWLRAERRPADDGPVWIWFADNGNIRKWQSAPFPEGVEYRRAATLPPDAAGLEAEWTDGQLLDHVCSLALGFGATGRDDVLAEYKAAKASMLSRLTALSAREAKMREALADALNGLDALSHIHDGNPSDAMADMPAVEYARHMLYEARQIAREAASEARARLASDQTGAE